MRRRKKKLEGKKRANKIQEHSKIKIKKWEERVDKRAPQSNNLQGLRQIISNLNILNLLQWVELHCSYEELGSFFL